MAGTSPAMTNNSAFTEHAQVINRHHEGYLTKPDGSSRVCGDQGSHILPALGATQLADSNELPNLLLGPN
jgi:hypothetical protein